MVDFVYINLLPDQKVADFIELLSNFQKAKKPCLTTELSPEEFYKAIGAVVCEKAFFDPTELTAALLSNNNDEFFIMCGVTLLDSIFDHGYYARFGKTTEGAKVNHKYGITYTKGSQEVRRIKRGKL